MGPFNHLILAAYGLYVLAACTPAPPPISTAPYPVQYTCDQSRRAAAEYAALPEGTMLRRYVDDYGAERGALRRLHKLPDPKACER
jgi:hypothetical protein